MGYVWLEGWARCRGGQGPAVFWGSGGFSRWSRTSPPTQKGTGGGRHGAAAAASPGAGSPERVEGSSFVGSRTDFLSVRPDPNLRAEQKGKKGPQMEKWGPRSPTDVRLRPPAPCGTEVGGSPQLRQLPPGVGGAGASRGGCQLQGGAATWPAQPGPGLSPRCHLRLDAQGPSGHLCTFCPWGLSPGLPRPWRTLTGSSLTLLPRPAAVPSCHLHCGRLTLLPRSCSAWRRCQGAGAWSGLGLSGQTLPWAKKPSCPPVSSGRGQSVERSRRGWEEHPPRGPLLGVRRRPQPLSPGL